MRFYFFVAAFSLTSICSAQLKPCYDVDGNLKSHIPCDPSANVSACCFLGGHCMTNFYCHGASANDTFDRVGTCTDKSGNDPACPLPFLRDRGVPNWFTYADNTTNCGDGTFCMNPGNETCCFNGKGVKEITYHNPAPIPTVAEAWNTYYADAGYSVPTITSDTSTSTYLSSKSVSISSTPTAFSVQSPSLNLPQSLSNPLTATNTSKPRPTSSATKSISPSKEAIIGTAATVGALGVVGLIYLFRRARAKRLEKHSPKPAPEEAKDKDSGLTAPEALTQWDATWNWPLEEAQPRWRHELSGHDGRGHELPGHDGRGHELAGHDGRGHELAGHDGRGHLTELPT